MAKAVEPPAVQVVTETFVVMRDGALVRYTKGQPIEADDPVLKMWPEKFGQIVFPHPVKRRAVRVASPEVRAD